MLSLQTSITAALIGALALLVGCMDPPNFTTETDVSVAATKDSVTQQDTKDVQSKDDTAASKGQPTLVGAITTVGPRAAAKAGGARLVGEYISGAALSCSKDNQHCLVGGITP